MVSTGATVVLVMLILAVVVLFLSFCVVLRLCFREGDYRGKKESLEDYEEPSLLEYWKHEHSLLGILWSEPIYPREDYYLTRSRRVYLLLMIFLLNFLVVGFVTLFTPVYPDCSDAKEAMTQAVIDRAGPTFLNEFQVGYASNLRQYVYDEPAGVSPVFNKYLGRAQSTSLGIAESRPCWMYCKGGNTSRPEPDFISRLLIFSRDLTDHRLECENVQTLSLTRAMVCYDYHWRGDTDCESSVLTSLSSTAFILRTVLIVFVVLPTIWVMKRILRCISLENRGCTCLKRFLGYPLVLVILFVCFLLAWVLAVGLQGEIMGDLVISFLFGFLLSLLFDFPKLALFYAVYKRKRLVREYEEAVLAQGGIPTTQIAPEFKGKRNSSSSSDGSRASRRSSRRGSRRPAPADPYASAYASRAAPELPCAYGGTDFNQPAPGSPYGAPPLAHRPSRHAPGFAPPPGNPYGAPTPCTAAATSFQSPY